MLSKLGNNRIGGDLLACSSRGFEQRTDQTEDLKFGACCFSAKHTTLRGKSKDWSARNLDIVSKWSDMSTNRLLFQ